MRSRELASVQSNAREFQLFVFGHTHEAESTFQPMQDTLSEWQPTAINTGAWQRVIHPVDLEKWRGSRPHGVVLAAQPSALPQCYSLVIVPPYQTNTAAQLQYWTQTSGRWGLADSCSWTPPVP
jgi:hypothetical protein